ncbi:Aste57867_8245 [Aphanomyces stellatus]|uniref:Aste57867_8245 protein n=1 Tax=Aphanomyces stellatus TaxID=120398 RepID=A0A485KJW8_9STRA|nr:hypothetical protein As57867_008214 [Aphanomyces stellatus]VFT85132.1 Aste57867_8245 [Aphanomyces stellatus]
MKRLLAKAKEKRDTMVASVVFTPPTMTHAASPLTTTDHSLARHHQGHVTQIITTLKSKAVTAIAASVHMPTVPPLHVPAAVSSAISRVRRRAANTTAQLAPAQRVVQRVSFRAKRAIAVLADKLHVSDAITKPLGQLAHLANKYVLAKLPSLGLLDKLKKFAKVFFVRSDADRASRANALVERFVRVWAARVKARLAAMHYREAAHAAATNQVARLVDTTTALFVARVQDATRRQRATAARVLQHVWRHALARWRLARADRARVALALRDLGHAMLCREMATAVVAHVMDQVWAARTLQRVWRGHVVRRALQQQRRRRRPRRRQSSPTTRHPLDSSTNDQQRALFLATLKRVWAREDFSPTLPRRRRRMFTQLSRPTLAPLAPRTPPHGQHGQHKLSVTKWQQQKGHVTAARCWVAIPIHVDVVAPKTTQLSPLPRHYALTYDYVPGTLLDDAPTQLPTFDETVRRLELHAAERFKRGMARVKSSALL